MKTPLTKERFQYHLQYSWWKYVSVVFFVFFAVNMFFTTTGYRPPEDKKVDWYISATNANQDAIELYLAEAKASVLQDMEQVSCVVMMSNDGSDPYTTMQLSTYIMAGEGDIYLLSKDDFQNYASAGATLALDPFLEDGTLNAGDLDLSKGIATYRDDELAPPITKQFGIPADELVGLRDFYIDGRDMVLCVMAAGKNDANSLKLLNYMLSTLLVQANESAT